MSLLEKASLVVTPNAYKESKLYSVIPNTTLGDMDVVRATTATRVNEQGLIEVVPRNLYQYSNIFTNGVWTNFNLNITTNQVGYDGTNNASLLVENNVNSIHLISNTPTLIGQITISVYAKANTRNWLFLRGVQSGVAVNGWFNLSNGTLGTIASNGTASITDVGNGWYRCSLTIANFDTGFETYIGVSNADNVTSYLGNGSSIFIQNAQVEQGSTATTYFPTTTRLNIPRIDYTNGSCPSLLVEPQRTNVITYSEQLNNAAWSKDNLIVTENVIISPNGTLNADKISEDITNSIHRIREVGRASSIGTTYTASGFFKSAERNKVFIGITDLATGEAAATFDLTNGTAINSTSGSWTNISYSIKPYVNGWYYCTVTGTQGAGGGCRVDTYISNGSTISYAGINDYGLYMWGAQLEVGSYATSYIPTVASSVTRNADVISKTGISSLIGQTEGTIFCEFNALGYYDSNNMIITLSDATTANRIFLNLTNGVGDLEAVITASGVTTVSYLGTVPTIGNHKIALSYKNNDVVIYLDGILIYSDNTVTIPLTSKLNIGSYVNDSNQFNSRINSAQLYKTRLTNTELAQLTTI